MYVQLIDDNTGHTLVAASLKDLAAPARRSVPRSPKGEVGSTKGEGGKKVSVESAAKLGKVLAEKAKKKKIEKVVFDRNAYKYHGRVKALAEAARKGGLIF
jgi:large subunit ribosomal protein L18